MFKNTTHPTIKKLKVHLLLGIIAFLLLSPSFYIIDTGNIGITKTLGTINPDEIPPGVHFRTPFVTSVAEYSARENQIDLNDMRPKASDNLSLRDFDVTVYYSVAPSRIADLRIKYALPAVFDKDVGVLMPAYELVRKQARSAVYEAVAKVPSLEIHKKREELEQRILAQTQHTLDDQDPGTFKVSRIIIRSVLTDPSIEKSIQAAVDAEKKLEAKKIQVEIAKKDAEIEIARSRGIAKANEIINDSLTPEYLQHEMNKALITFAEQGNSSVVIPANMGNVQMLLPAKQLGSKAP